MRCALALAPILLLSACGRPDAGNEASVNGAIVSGNEVENVGEAPNAAQSAAPEESDVPLDALAGVRIGETVADLRAQGIAAEKDDGPDPDNSCGYARVPGLTDVFLMLDGDTVVRIDVATDAYATLGGVKVGMSEAEALRRLGDRVKVEPHPYRDAESGHYLVVHQKGAPLGLILETDAKKILTWRIGRWEQVQWVEGCL